MGFLGEVLVTILAALLGAWGGARAALARFKEERAFDQQLKWYTDTVRAFLEAEKAASGLAGISKRQGDTVGANRAVKRFSDATKEALNLAEGGWVFASGEALYKLERARRALSLIVPSPSEGSIRDLEDPERLDRLSWLFKAAAREVAKEGRAHLELEDVDVEALKARLEELEGERVEEES